MPNDPEVKTEPGKFHISVRNFGPVESADIEMKPLTVFVGKSNSGKTYLATLIYAVYEELGGFPRLPSSKKKVFKSGSLNSEIPNKKLQESFEEFKSVLATSSKEKYLSDYPNDVQDELFSSEYQRDEFFDNLVQSIAKTFDTTDIADLCRSNGNSKELRVKFGYSENGQCNWNVKINHDNSKTNCNVSFLDKIPIPPESTNWMSKILPSAEARLEEMGIFYYKIILNEFLEFLSFPESNSYSSAHYLPAVRGGIMQSHKFVASMAVSILWKAGLEESLSIPRLPKTSTEFIRKLILINDGITRRARRIKAQNNEQLNAIQSIAKEIEESVIGGKISITKENDESFPEYYFNPEGLEGEFTISRSSSMVGELAPIVLFVRNLVSPFDLIIVEEPEAHLHASAQIAIAECLAMLVRNKVRVLITTHSEWFLRCLQGLIFQGELEKLQNGTNRAGETYLHQDEVGVWEFTTGENKGGTKVKKIEFQHETGIELTDLDDLDLDLYNKVASVRNEIALEKVNYTPKNIGNRLSIKADRVRKELKKLGIKPKRGGRYTFKKDEYDKISKLIRKNIQ